MNIVLTGFMASGKTRISKELSDMLGFEFTDTDMLIEQKTNMTINEIFKLYGETEFRRIESEIVAEVSNSENTVISTGGGVVLNPKNIERLRKNGIIVNLAPEFEVILKRLESAKETRPLLRTDDIEDIRERFNDRLPFYADCDIKIKVSDDHTPRYYARIIAEKAGMSTQ